MADGSTHRIITTTNERAERRLALEIRSWKLGFAVFDDDLPRLFHPVITEDFKTAANSFGVR